MDDSGLITGFFRWLLELFGSSVAQDAEERESQGTVKDWERIEGASSRREKGGSGVLTVAFRQSKRQPLSYAASRASRALRYSRLCGRKIVAMR